MKKKRKYLTDKMLEKMFLFQPAWKGRIEDCSKSAVKTYSLLKGGKNSKTCT